MKAYLKKNLRLFLFAALAILAALFSWFRVFEQYELATYDWRCQVRGPRPVSDKVVLVDIWDDALQEFGAWPFKRVYHSYLIDALHAFGAKAVAFDILFAEPNEGDDAVVESAKKADNVYFVYGFHGAKRGADGHFTAPAVLAPLLDDYHLSAKDIGHINPSPDIDGKRRKIFPAIRYEEKTYYPLGILLAMEALGAEKAKTETDRYRMRLSDGTRIPFDKDGFITVNFAGVWEKTFRHYSYLDVIVSHQQILAGRPPRLDPSLFKDAVCVVGLTSTASHDSNPIPIQSAYPMVGIHANVLNSVLMKDFIRRAGPFWNLLFLTFLVALIGYLSFKKRPITAFYGSFIALAAYFAAVVGAFVFAGIWVDLFCPMATAIVVYAAVTLSRVMQEMRKRELLESELKTASRIQQSFLPETLPVSPYLEVAVYMKPAKAVGGDLYTFVPIADDVLGVMAGDVSGKGTPAALFMAKVVSEFKYSARGKTDPAEVLSALNDAIANEATGGLFVTLVYAVFDLKNHRMVLANGGHLPVVMVRKNGEKQLLTPDEGMPIGVMTPALFSSLPVSAEEGDCLAFYSDGVSEARNRKKEEFGVEALQAAIADKKEADAVKILDEAVTRLNHFMGNAEQHDDITLIIVKMKSKTVENIAAVEVKLK